MNFTAQELMEKIIELRIQLDYQIVEVPSEQITDSIQYNAKELIATFEQLKFFYPQEFEQFLEYNPKYKPLEVISLDNSVGLKQIINCISQDTEQTVAAIAQQVQTHQFHQWVKKNSRSEIEQVCETEADKAVYVHMSQFNLPQVKQEEIGDCIALAFTGKLSEKYELFQDTTITEQRKQKELRQLMVNNRLYLNWDFNSLTVEDMTEQYQQRKTLYRPRGVAASKIIDSTYSDGKHLFAVISTNNTDTSSQRAQAFEIYKTLQANHELQSLQLEENGNNLIPSVILFNNAFFCTENPDKIQYTAPDGTEKTGYHHKNSRTIFDNMFEKPLSKSQLDKINGLTTLSMIGNKEISWPRFPHTFDICDIIHCNPLTAGADTLWLYTKFEQFKIYTNPERTQKFFNFLLDYSSDIADYLLKIKPNANEALLGDIKNSFERLLAGVTRNFNSYNLGRELNEKEVEKLKKLEDKIMDFNINQPNQSIDANLSVAITPFAFEQQGKRLTKTVEKRQELFNNIEQKEQEQKDMVLEMVQQARDYQAEEQNQTHSENKEDNIFKQLDGMAFDIYKNEQGKSIKLSEYIQNILLNIQSATKYNTDYFKAPHGSFYYVQNFLRQSGYARKNFDAKVQRIAELDSNLAMALENADQKITTFLRQFHTKEGRLSLIEQGGIIKAVSNLCDSLQEDMGLIRDNTTKRYDEFQEKTPFGHIEHRNLGSYWELQVEKASKFNNFDGMIGIIHEYLHRIEDKFEVGETVSGKSLADLPKKIYILKKMASQEAHVIEAVDVLVSRYNYLGELFDQQNKDRKKYKPKHYRIT